MNSKGTNHSVATSPWLLLKQKVSALPLAALALAVVTLLLVTSCGGVLGGGGNNDEEPEEVHVLPLTSSRVNLGILSLETTAQMDLEPVGGVAPYVFLDISDNPYAGKVDTELVRGKGILKVKTHPEGNYSDADFQRTYITPIVVQDSVGTFATIEVSAQIASSNSTGGCHNINPVINPKDVTVNATGIVKIAWSAEGVTGSSCDLSTATWSYTIENAGYVTTGTPRVGDDGTAIELIKAAGDSKDYSAYTMAALRRGVSNIHVTITPAAIGGATAASINSNKVAATYTPADSGDGDGGGDGGIDDGGGDGSGDGDGSSGGGDDYLPLVGGSVNAGLILKGDTKVIDLKPIGGKLPYSFKNSIPTNIVYSENSRLGIVAPDGFNDIRTFTDTVTVTDAKGDTVTIKVNYTVDNSPPFVPDTGACENLAPTLTEWLLSNIDADGNVTLEWNSYYVKNCDLRQGSWTYTIVNVNLPGGRQTYDATDEIVAGSGDGTGTPFSSSTVATLPVGNSQIFITVIPKGSQAGVRTQTLPLVFGKADDLFEEVDVNTQTWTDDPDSVNWGMGALSNPQFDPKNVSANFKKHITKDQFEAMFPLRWGSDQWDAINTGAVPHLADEPDFFSYDNFVAALEDMARLKLVVRRREGTNLQEVIRLNKITNKQMTVKIDGDFYASWNNNKPIISEYVDFGAFANEGSDEQQRREIAAFFANIGHETTGGGGGWNAPGGSHTWALFFREEVAWAGWKPGDPVGYVQEAHPDYPGTPGQSYHGRGPIQLSWNYNYGYMSALVFGDTKVLLDNPSMITANGTLAFDTGIWFWMTPQAPKPSAHSIIAGTWDYHTEPVAKSNNIQDGFGATVNVINGGLEAGPFYSREIKIENGVLRDGGSNNVLTAFYLAALDSRGIEDRTSPNSIAVNLGLNSIKEIRVDNDKLVLRVQQKDGSMKTETVSVAGDYKVSGGGLKGNAGYILKFRIKPGSPVQVSDYTDITFDGSLSEIKGLSNAQLGTSDKFSEFVTLQSSGTQYIVVEDYRVHDRINFYDYFVRTLTGKGDLLGHQIGAKNQKSFF